VNDVEEMTEAVTRHVCDDDEIVTRWVLTAEVVGPEHRYLAHRSGTADGEHPMIWDALGMLRSSVLWAEVEFVDATGDEHDEDED
jgi:hypothetical protein